MRSSRLSLSLAQMSLIAAMSSMPAALGQQRQIRVNPGSGVKRVDPPRGRKDREPRRGATQADFDALDKAQAKRDRKSAHLDYCAARGAFKQTATVRS